MRLGEDVCLIDYFNAFDSKMVYNLREKETRTLRDAYKMDINIENNKKHMVSWGEWMTQNFSI